MKEIKTLLFKREWHDEYKKYDCVRTVMRRINRETKSQFISDVQRIPVDYSQEPLVWKNFQVVARRYRKKKLFNSDGTLSNYYGNSTFIKGDISPLVGDKLFEDMFRIVKCPKDDLFGYEISLWERLTKTQRLENQAFCCIDDGSYVSKHLGELFGLPVYFVDRIFNNTTREHFKLNFKKSNDYERNVIFYQVTSSGDDKKNITTEENDENEPIFIWAFKDKIVYKTGVGYNEW